MKEYLQEKYMENYLLLNAENLENMVSEHKKSLK